MLKLHINTVWQAAQWESTTWQTELNILQLISDEGGTF